MITSDEIRRFFAQARPREDLLQKLIELTPRLAQHYGMSEECWRRLIANVAAETGGLSIVRESMNYSAGRILEVFQYRLKVARTIPGLPYKTWTLDRIAQHLASNPDELARVVYGFREGNEGSGRYIGRGLLQTTHKINYAAVENEIRRQPGGQSVPGLITHPEALEEPEWAVRSAFAEWKIKGLGRLGSFREVCAKINTGSPEKWSIVNGKDHRERFYARVLGVWPQSLDGMLDVTVEALQEALAAKGYPVGKIDGWSGPTTTKELMAFQRDMGRDPTGVLDSPTWAALEIAPPKKRWKENIWTVPVADADLVETANAGDAEQHQTVQETRKATRDVGWLSVLFGGGWAESQFGILDMISSSFDRLRPVVEFLAQHKEVAGLLGFGVAAYLAYRTIRHLVRAHAAYVAAYQRGEIVGGRNV